ncbi:Teichoic acid translocation permease protein TagG [Andreprevotia sp. IGB-42]|uniref:ABC transporter permease n=1 Tax=Andreprevotia sp. IGB-42 TaxID=2497473 RepID=UPI001356FCD6|nr:ABC transporter permease [Andreprevotia sp. IGB-42]KAF0811427.1 Teichoic acid translocation permease protein TagG [Andreprevotia sp. IGB-42]
MTAVHATPGKDSGLLQFFLQLLRQRALIGKFVTREMHSRYRGSLLGLMWSFVTPLLMLAVYTFVFSVVFKARWGVAQSGDGHFALMLFAGITVFSLFAEVVSRAPMLIVQQANYVKKVVFPLEVLPVSALGVAAVHTLITLLMLVVAAAWVQRGLPASALAVPLIFAPLLLLLLGLAWILAALGTYLRDIGQLIGLVVTAMQFLSPVFYPVSALPQSFQPMLRANPVTLPIESLRLALFAGQWPDWSALAVYSLIAVAVALGGAWLFMRLRTGFADVL